MVTGEAIACPAEALTALRDFVRVDGASEDAVLGGLCAAAMAACEAFTGQVLVTRDFRETCEAGGAWRRLGRTPVVEIARVSGADGTALAADVYAVDIDADGDGWVRAAGSYASTLSFASIGRARPVRVEYRAGMATDWAGVPEALRHGIVRLAAHLYASRDGGEAPPVAVTALWRPYRRMRLGGGAAQ